MKDNIYMNIIDGIYDISNYRTLYSLNKRSYDTDDVYFENELHILLSLVENENISIVEIANKLYKTKSYISQVISGLQKKGLVEKTKSETDARRTVYKITDKGMLVYYAHQYYDKKQCERLAAALKDYSSDDLALILKFLADYHQYQLDNTNAITDHPLHNK